MATGAQTWSTSAASNNSADSSVNWAEGMAPSAVNNSARAEMASMAMWLGDNSGVLASSGSSSAYTITSKQVSTALVDGYTIAARMHVANNASATLNVDGVGAKAIHLYAGTPVAGGEFLAGSIQHFTYNSASTCWVLHDYRPASISSLLGADGTVSAPTFSFSSDTDSGLYRIGANNVGMTMGGTKITDWSTAGVSITGTHTVSGKITGSSSMEVTGNALFSGTVTASGKLTASSSLEVTGAALLSGAATISGAATLSSSLTVANGTLLSSGLIVSGAATLSSSLTVTGAALFNGATTIANTATVTSSLVAAAASFSGKVTHSSSSEFANAVLCSSDVTVSGGLTVSSTVSGATVAGSMVATQANMETGTATNLVVTPGRQHFHPAMPKAWAYVVVDGTTPTLTASYNVTSVTDNGVGDFTINLTNAMSSANYAVVASCFDDTPENTVTSANVISQTASAIRINTYINTGIRDNLDFSIVVFGDM